MKKTIFSILLLLGQGALFAQNFTNPLAIPPVIDNDTIDLNLQTGITQFYPGINTNTMGANGSFLGPTLVMHQGDTVHINVTNSLGEPTTIHWHGMHIPADMDGGPHTEIPSGTTWNVHYEVKNAASVCWYHPHLHMNTGPHVYAGIAGLIYVQDPIEGALNLPRTYGVDDFPLVLQDRSFDGSGQFFFEAMADSMLINGTPNPFLDVPAQVVRLRVLNGSNARAYVLGFSDNRNFEVIASDGGLLSQPFTTNRLKISNGERYEILLDLSTQQGSSFTMMSYGSQLANNEPGGGGMPNGNTSLLNGADFSFLQLNVVAPTSTPVTSIPTSLISHAVWPTANAARTRVKTLSGNGMFNMGNFLINGTAFDMMVVNDTIFKDDIEIWQIVNTTNIAHPFHIHDVPFYIIERNGTTPPAYEQGLKDVVYLKSNESIKFITKFENFTNDSVPYMFHCHNLVHEDDGMMSQFIVIEPTAISELSGKHKEVINVYPNPSNGIWNLSVPQGEIRKANVILVDQTGREVINTAVDAFPCELNGSFLPTGVYFLRVESEERVFVGKLIRQ